MGKKNAQPTASDKKSKEVTPKMIQRQQYHYFYGSIDENGAAPGRSDCLAPTGNADQDSLVGEDLLQTDNEDDNPRPGGDQDYQHLVMTNGNGVHPILGPGNNERPVPSRRSRPCFLTCSWGNVRDSHPIAHIVMVVVCSGMVFVAVTMLLFPPSKRASMATQAAERSFRVPFPSVDRAEYNDPVPNFLDKSLFDPKFLYKGRHPSREFTFPFPTGAFWTNLVLTPTADQGFSYPIAVYPYAYKWSESKLQISYPAEHRKEEPKMIHDYFFPDLTFSCDENISARHVTHFDALSVTLRFLAMNDGYFETYLVQGSPYVTIKYDNVKPEIRVMSIFSSVACPRDGDVANADAASNNKDGRRFLKYGVCYSSSPDEGGNDATTLTGVQFILQSQEAMSWIIFASEPITLVYDRVRKTSVVASEKFRGVLRIAYIPDTKPESDNLQISSSSGLQRLVYHAGVYPVSGDVSWSFRADTSDSMLNMVAKRPAGDSLPISNTLAVSQENEGRIGTLHFNFATGSFTEASSASTPKPLLMLALPHHAQSLPSAVQLSRDKFDLVYRCIKGSMRPILGSSWAYDESLPNLGMDGDRGSHGLNVLIDEQIRQAIVLELEKDLKIALPTTTENVYGFGKQSARLAQLAHIAKQIIDCGGRVSLHNSTDNSHSPDDSVKAAKVALDEAVALLSNFMKKFLSGNVSDTLVYDLNLGGLVTTDGLRDSQADFGNGRYNDHLFHNGYILYAAAVLAHLDPEFLVEYGGQVDAIYFDVAHDGNFDSATSDVIFFPGARHKAWYDGHSYASGLFPFGNGKSQESSSEAVNCYYASYLWSLARSGSMDNPSADTSARTDFARLLLATEVRGARTYWHMIPWNGNATSNATDPLATVYSPAFSDNYMVGNLGMMDAICSTWFGTETLYVHMINFLPVTSITGNLFDQQFVEKEYPNVLQPLGKVQMAWRGYVTANQAIMQPNAAWREAQSLFSPELDSGISKSQVLYWIATRTGFNSTEARGALSDREPRHPSTNDAESAGCIQHPACTGLSGNCCPTDDGVFLGCCDER